MDLRMSRREGCGVSHKIRSQCISKAELLYDKLALALGGSFGSSDNSYPHSL